MTPGAMEYSYHSLFEDHKTVKVMSYNLETIIAEKIETVVSRKTDNSRSCTRRAERCALDGHAGLSKSL